MTLYEDNIYIENYSLDDILVDNFLLKTTLVPKKLIQRYCRVHKPEVPRGPTSAPRLGLGEQPVALGPARKV